MRTKYALLFICILFITGTVRFAFAEDKCCKCKPDIKDFTSKTDFIIIKGGCFMMGDIWEDAPGDAPPHRVCVSDFSIAKNDIGFRDR